MPTARTHWTTGHRSPLCRQRSGIHRWRRRGGTCTPGPTIRPRNICRCRGTYMMTIDRITGMLTGVLLGDMLGSTVEGWSPQQVEEKHGRITGLLPGSCTTDAWQLTVAVCEALISSGMDMDAQAAAHVTALKDSSARWGRTTLVAVHSLAVGKHWSVSGQLLGIGNGVVMKIAPVAAILAATADGAEREKIERFAIDLTRMTTALIFLPVGVSMGRTRADGSSRSTFLTRTACRSSSSSTVRTILLTIPARRSPITAIPRRNPIQWYASSCRL